MDEERFVTALRNGDPHGVEEILRSLGDRLLRSAFLLCGRESDAQDLVQETFLQAIRSIHRFKGHSSLYTWLHGILLNLSRHYHRNRDRLVSTEELSQEPTSDSDETCLPGDADAISRQLRQALTRLSAPHREALILRFYEEMKIDEIARHLGISTGTVKSRLHYALSEMQRFMPEEMNLLSAKGTHLRQP